MTPDNLTDDAKVILLLCGYFGKEARPVDGSPPLSTADYGRFSAFLHDKGLRPASLLKDDVLVNLEIGMSPVAISRIRRLLSRGAAMSFAVEGWMNKGLWILCRSDTAYPRRLKCQLGKTMAPPILYGAGDQALLDRGGLAIVGSRNIGPEEEAFASRVANRCAADNVQVVSGGARGVDQVSMREALDSGGAVVGVLGDGLLKKSLQRVHREALHAGRLVLVSTVNPEAGFSVGAAMGRNKFIYALADHGLVVKAEFQKGGTWAGAVEELDRPGGRSVFVNPQFSPQKMVDALLAKGALPFPGLTSDKAIDAILTAAVATASQTGSSCASPPMVDGELPLQEEPTDATICEDVSVATPPEPVPEPLPPDSRPHTDSLPTFFEAVWPLLQVYLAKPIKPTDLAQAGDVRKVQVDDWLKQAHQCGLVRKLNKPVRYVLNGAGNLKCE